jgi:CHAT domain-containing protein
VREARTLGRRYEQADVLLLASTRSAIGPDDLSGYDVLHFATHTSVNDQNPWQSAIYLDSVGDGKGLRAAEIAAMKLPVSLVVLSSCESAAGRILSGEGVLGLSSAFISAGSPAVVATLWPVDDLATVGFMEAFYGELAARQDAASALRRAQDKLREDPATEHPFFWAGFVLVGDGDVQVYLKPDRGRDRLLVVALLGLVVITVLVSRFRRR